MGLVLEVGLVGMLLTGQQSYLLAEKSIGAFGGGTLWAGYLNTTRMQARRLNVWNPQVTEWTGSVEWRHDSGLRVAVGHTSEHNVGAKDVAYGAPGVVGSRPVESFDFVKVSYRLEYP